MSEESIETVGLDTYYANVGARIQESSLEANGMKPEPDQLGREYRFRDIFDRVAYLRETADQRSLDPWTLWLSVLKRFVLTGNDSNQFDDILEHDAFVAVDSGGIADVLQGCSIAEVSVLYEYLLATDDMAAKRDKGQFFTPDDVAQFMAAQTDEFPAGIWLDPCCGVGNLAYWLIARQPDPEQFLLTSMRFIDLDARALLTARTMMTVAFQRSRERLFTDLESSFLNADFLSDDLMSSQAFAGEFDYVLMNPPYVQAPPPSAGFETAKSRDLYAYFLERALKLSKGLVAITPQTYTNARRHRDLREIILRHAQSASIFCFDNVPDNIFKGYKFGSENTNRVNSTRAAVIVALRETSKADGIRITPLVRWRAAQRPRLFDEVPSLLSRPQRVDATLFPKVPPGLEGYYEDLSSHRTPLARTVAVDGSTQLLVPTTPRYFISAVRRSLDRASARLLSFDNDDDLLRAYLTLNSSIAYLWWRVRDGGMTLSQETLMSMPIDHKLDMTRPEATSLIKRLQESERSNVVVKLNSGRENENVKHPLDLVLDINRFLAPDHAETLLRLHDNSYIPA